MGLFGKLFASASAEVSQKAANAEQALDMKVSKDLVEGVISGCLLVSFVDGSCDDEELEALEAVLDAEETFEPWAAEFQKLIQRYSKKLRAGYKLGKRSALEELGQLKGNSRDAAICFACIETVAEQGGVSAEEKEVLSEIANALGVAYRG